MTTKAREVLDDCRGALAELSDGVQGPVWRRRWITAVVLLRVVGHVLDKVDGARSNKHKKSIDKWWKALNLSKPEPEIFWLFIEEERNTIVKEYQTNAGQGVTIQLTGQRMAINQRPSEQKIVLRNPPIYHYTMNAGHYKGRDQRELIADAIKWWELQLDIIDNSIIA